MAFEDKLKGSGGQNQVRYGSITQMYTNIITYFPCHAYTSYTNFRNRAVISTWVH